MRILTCGKKLDKQWFKQTTNGRMFVFNKPDGGLWGSTYLPDQEYKSDWLRWVVSENYHADEYNSATSYTLHRWTNICNINSIEDYEHLLDKYSMTYSEFRSVKFDEYSKRYINWELLSKDYDAFHLSEDAFWQMRIMFSCNYADFHSYDCESWIIFNYDCINHGSILNHNFNYKV